MELRLFEGDVQLASEEDYEEVPPNAGPMSESLRALGYKLRTAVADIIDNSITAESKNVWILFWWEGRDSHVRITDDGCGLTESELVDAMRPGSRSPSEVRDAKDLGRWGLGLKTASFSQCKRLTVLTKKKNSKKVSIRCWDLDVIKETCEWRLLKPDKEDYVTEVKELTKRGNGTIVRWDKLDRIVGDADIEDKDEHNHFLARVDLVKMHLAMIFHRYLEGKRLRLHMNKTPIVPWDPFLRKMSATQQLPGDDLTISGHKVKATPYVLPHHSKFQGDEHAAAGGIDGWNQHQGFYIYRNERLIIDGTWLGFYRKEDHYKLARIQIDIPTSEDHAWQIDVKKSSAHPPSSLLKDLKRIAKVTRERAQEVYRYRGKSLARRASSTLVYVWRDRSFRGKVHYIINRNHPLIQNVLEKAKSINKEFLREVKSVLRLIEETIPVPLIMIKTREKPDSEPQPFETSEAEEVLTLMEDMYIMFQKQQKSHEEIRNLLINMVPFLSRPDMAECFFESKEREIGGN